MLIITYGIPKSGSTLTHELVRAMLVHAGYSQDLESEERRTVQPLVSRMKRNFSGTLSRAEIEELMAKIGPEGRIAVKTHAWFEIDDFIWLDALCEKGEVLVIASYRDPRDLCLSLMDAANKARNTGSNAFSNIRDMEHASRKIRRRVEDFRRWSALQGTIRVDYEDVAFATEKVIDRLEQALGFVCNREEILRYLFSEAITLKNKAKSRRHEEELDAAQNEALSRHFHKFLSNGNDQEWFDKIRKRLMKKSRAEE